MDILRFITAGSVDDGKSTLIGRLLYDSRSLLDDQIVAIQQNNGNGMGAVNLALITDGLRAEREQGITIDVAYKYFTTKQRKFIIADTPGHVQYTRNMITGASTVDAAVLLIDARKGITEQTKRHFALITLMGIRHIIVTVNKMDLVGYSEQIFESIKRDFNRLSTNTSVQTLHFIPIVAIDGDNVVTRSTSMTWYQDVPLLPLLESLPIQTSDNLDHFRFQVQCVLRPQTDELHDYRGFAGKVLAGTVNVGDTTTIFPTDKTTTITSIERYGVPVLEANVGDNIVLQILDDIEISRGDYFTSNVHQPKLEQEITTTVCWMADRALKPGQKYLLQQGSRRTKVLIQEVQSIVDIHTFHHTTPTEEMLNLNDIGVVRLRAASRLVYDPFKTSKVMGSGIMIDEIQNLTVGACLMQ